MARYKILIKYSNNNEKHKFNIIIENFKNLKIGNKNKKDFISCLNEKEKEIKLKKLNKNIDLTINGIFEPKFWEYYLLWNKKTLYESVMFLKNKFIEIDIEIM